MESRSVTLVIRFKASNGKWCRRPAARGANGRVKPSHAMIDGEAQAVADGSYEIRQIVDRQPKYLPAGKSAAAAEAQRVRLEQATRVIEAAKGADVEVSLRTERRSLKETAAEYIRDAVGRQAMEAAGQARLVSSEFIDLMRKKNKNFVDEVVREDILSFHRALEARGCGDRTVANKHSRLTSWLRFAGMDREKFPPKPRYEKKLPTIYTPELLAGIFRVADPCQRMACNLALKLGLRDQEIQYAEFNNILWYESVFRVRSKPKYKFKVKDSEQRDIPIPRDLLEELRVWRDEHPDQSLIVPTASGKPNAKLLRMVKDLARLAGIQCGVCDNCRKGAKGDSGCKEFQLHTFRRTCFTAWLRSGIDPRTVMAYAGHADFATVLRYLRPAAARENIDAVSGIRWY